MALSTAPPGSGPAVLQDAAKKVLRKRLCQAVVSSTALMLRMRDYRSCSFAARMVQHPAVLVPVKGCAKGMRRIDTLGMSAQLALQEAFQDTGNDQTGSLCQVTSVSSSHSSGPCKNAGRVCHFCRPVHMRQCAWHPGQKQHLGQSIAYTSQNFRALE